MSLLDDLKKKNPGFAQVEKGLQQGQSWESIAKNSGVALDRVKAYSKSTRPDYGVKKSQPNLLQTLGNAAGSTVDTLRAGLMGQGGIGQSALQFNKGVGENVQGILHAPGRAVKSLGLDVRGQQSYTPQGLLEQGIYGKDAVVNSQQRGANDLNDIGSIFGNAKLGTNASPILNRIAGTVGNVLDASAIAAPLEGAIAKNAPKVARAVAPLAKDAKNAARDAVDQAGIPASRPDLKVPFADRTALNDFVDMQMGRYSPTSNERNALIQRAYDIGDQYGLDVRTGGSADVQDRVANFMDNLQRQKQYIREGGFIQAVPGATEKEVLPTLQAPQQIAQNRLTQGAREGRQNVSDEVARQVQGEHIVRNTEALNQRGIQSADALESPALFDEANSRMQVKSGTINDEDVSFINQAIERADREGNVEEATNLHDQLSEHLVANGQTSQAAILLYNRSPQGLLNKAVKDINKNNDKSKQVTPELRKELQALADNIKNAPDQDAKELAIATLQKRVQRELPQSKLQGALSIWKAGLLSAPTTHAGNLLSNATFGTLNKISDIPATAVDAGISLFTGKRTKAFTTRGIGEGTKEGVKNSITTLKTGIDRRNIVDNKYDGYGELNFKNKAIQTVFGDTSNEIFRVLGASDQPFYYAAAKNSLYEQALVAGKNEKLSGKTLQDFVKNKVANPTKEMAQIAENDAKKAVLSEDNKLGNALSSFARKIPYGAGQVVVPFTKVPTNFLSQTLDYTPVGPIKQIIQQISNKKGFNQRDLSTAIGKATTGSAIIYLGTELANNKLLSGGYPTDAKEQQRWKVEGITPNSVKIRTGKDENGKDKYKWVSLNYLGPVGLLLNSGKDFADAVTKGDNAAIQSIAGLGKSLTGQSFLTSFTAFSNALQDPQRSAGSFVNSLAGSIVPNIVKSSANVIDEKQRQVNNPLESIQSGIPFAREGLNVKQDVYGNELERRSNPLDYFLNPFKPSSQTTNPTIDEVARLSQVDSNNSDLQVTPTQVNKSVTVDGEAIKLTDQQRYDLQKRIGQDTQDKWNSLIQTPEYQRLSDLDKASALNDLRKDSTAIAQRDFVQSNGLAQYKKDLTAKQKELASGNADLRDYARTPEELKAIQASKKTAKASTKKTATKAKSARTASTKKSSRSIPKSNDNATAISITSKASRATANAKISRAKATFQSKVKAGRTLEAYKKPTSTKVKIA